MKYWSLSKKVELVLKKKDTQSLDRKTLILFYIGVGFILFGAVGYGWSEWTYGSDLYIRVFYYICTIPLIISWILMTDAIRRMKKIAFSEHQVISSEFMLLHGGAFLLLAISTLLDIV
jgi:hypothetical protein